ncbi:hypothetical protein J6590_076711 [Homalodisca vitripennis]|nr:hypothetical protein J6590_076711 [Homalodisca vitripennis]
MSASFSETALWNILESKIAMQTTVTTRCFCAKPVITTHQRRGGGGWSPTYCAHIVQTGLRQYNACPAHRTLRKSLLPRGEREFIDCEFYKLCEPELDRKIGNSMKSDFSLRNSSTMFTYDDLLRHETVQNNRLRNSSV